MEGKKQKSKFLFLAQQRFTEDKVHYQPRVAICIP